jgi:hypothetical protein
MKATVTEKHLDAAIALRGTPGYSISRECIAAQVCKEVYGQTFEACASGVVCTTIHRDLKVTDEKFNNLVNKFDLHLYDSIRETLPMELELPELPA